MSVRLGTKLFFAQLPLGVSLITVGLLAVATIDTLGQGATSILKDNHQSVLATERMRDALDALQAAEFAFVLDADLGHAKTADAKARFDRELRAQENNITEAGEAELTARLRAEWQRAAALVERLHAAPTGERHAMHSEMVMPAFAATRQAIDRVLAINQDAMVRKSEHAGHLAEQRRAIMLVVLLAAVVLGIYASASLTRRLLSPLSVLTQAAKRLGTGDFVARARVEGGDEIAELANEFNTMAGHLSDYRNSSLGELLQAQQSAQAAIDSLVDPVLLYSAEGELTGFNEHAELTLRTMDATLRALVDRVLAHVLGGLGAYAPRGFDEAVSVPTADGERYLLPRATPIYAPSGAVQGAAIVLQDVTRLRRFDELKSDFVATVAHEFRTPLTSLRMAVHLCLEEKVGPVTERQADLLDTAKQDCQRLQSLVDELLELSRMESEQALGPREAVAANLLVDDAVERHTRLAGERGVSIVNAAAPFLPSVRVDRERVALVFDNLLVNALRHSPRGEVVTISAQVKGDGLAFSVGDHGAGIAPEHRERVFEKFFRVAGSQSGSAGLGLFIARQIVRTHGGDLTVTSEIGRGSTFSFTLPMEEPT